MFKKTLLALSVAGVASFSANAGIISAGITDTSVTVAAYADAGAGASDCAALATTYSATIDLNGQTPADAGADTVTGGVIIDGGDDDIYETAANVLQYTSATDCNITINSDILVEASNVSNSLEGAQANGVTVAAKLIAGVGGYTDEDTVRVTVAGGTIDEDASAGATLTGTTTTFTLLGVVGSDVLFTVDTGTQTGKEIVTLAGLNVIPTASVTELSLTAETQNTANVVYDQSASEKVTELEGQYTGAVDYVFDGIIDVATERLALEANADDTFGAAELVTDDSFVFEVEENTTQGNLAPDSVDVEIMGDFSWMAQLDTSDDDTAITSAELAAGFTYLSDDTDNTFAGTPNDVFDSAAINSDMDMLTITLDTTDGDVDPFHRVTWNIPAAATGTESLNEQDFTVSVTATDSAAADGDGYDAVAVASGTAAGAWTLNGSVVTIPYMPFDDNTAVIMRHTNTGVQSGDITVRYMLEGISTNWESAGVIGTSTRGVQNVRDGVVDAIKAAAGVTSGKVAIEITTNVPSEDVTVYAAYKVKDEQDRGFVGTFGEHGSAN